MISTPAMRRGAEAESRALAWLKTRGLKFVARNVRYRCGEIDLVMREGDTLVFVEVRYRNRSDYGGAIESVNAAKRTRIERAVRLYVAATPGAGKRPLRIDVVAMGPGESIEWIRNAFEETI